MKKTFYAMEVTLYEVTADVNHHNVSIDGGASTRREVVTEFYHGSLGPKPHALKCFEAVHALCREKSKVGAVDPAGEG